MLKTMMKRQLAALPKDQREKVEALVEKNPELILQIAKDVQEEMKSGKDQMVALQIVAERNKDLLKNLS